MGAGQLVGVVFLPEDSLFVVFNLHILAILNCHSVLRFQIVKLVVIDAGVPLELLFELIILASTHIKFSLLYILLRRFEPFQDFGKYVHLVIDLPKQLIIALNIQIPLVILAEVFYDTHDWIIVLVAHRQVFLTQNLGHNGLVTELYGVYEKLLLHLYLF